MKNRIRNLVAISSLSILASLNPPEGHAQDLKFGCLMAGALPDCPPVAKVDWWVGAWATRMTSPGGNSLTAFTALKPNGTYTSTLEYDDGRKVEHWGHYKIEFPQGRSSIKKTSVIVTEEARQIERSVQRTTVIKNQLVDLMAAAIPEDGADCNCASGRITYHVEGSDPELDFPSPQVFRFVQQADYGYVRVWGPGVEGRLGRLYAQK